MCEKVYARRRGCDDTFFLPFCVAQVRYDNTVTAQTKVKFMTDGVLQKVRQDDGDEEEDDEEVRACA